ncbi:MAG: hypothetical protein L0J11_11270 [Micrococcaceae bacterium]|nr:hypothetical protein [Micrococcaceae bacterium]
MYGKRRVGRAIRESMTETQRSRAARPAWQKRRSAFWATAWALAACSRISYRAGWPVPVTTTLLVIAIVVAVALLTRRIVTAVRGRSRTAER